jgi:hypothetical protein
MGILDTWRAFVAPTAIRPDAVVPYREVDTNTLVRNYEILETPDGEYMIVEPVNQYSEGPGAVQLAQLQPMVDDSPPEMRELGNTGVSSYGSIAREEYQVDLRDQAGLRRYDRMRRSNSSSRAALRLMKTPILAARWFVEPFEDTAEAHEQARFIEANFMQLMTVSWPQVIYEALLMLDYGYYMMEKVYNFLEWEGEQRVIWQKFAPRHPMDVVQWNLDDGGGPESVDLYNLPGSPGHVNIPIQKLAVFTFDKEGGDVRGMSIQRSAYQHWFFQQNLYKIDAIQKERHGIGVPIIKLPPGWTPNDKRLAHEIGRNLRTNEKAHVVLPPMWEIMFARLEGQPVSALESADHHNRMIFQNILGDFILDSSENTSKLEMFLKSTRYVAEIIRDVFNKYCIPQLTRWNWPDVAGYPELRVRRIGDTQDWRTLSFALRNMVGAGIMRADDQLEAWIRQEMDLPHADIGTIREVATPQQARVGPPRQSTAPGMRQQAQGTGSSNAGRDGSGGN